VRWKVLLIAAVTIPAIVLASSPITRVWAVGLVVLAVAVGVAGGALATMLQSRRRGSMVKSGLAVAGLILLALVPYTESDLSLLAIGFPGFVVAVLGYVLSILFIPDPMRSAWESALMVPLFAIYWVVNTAVLGMVLSHTPARPH